MNTNKDLESVCKDCGMCCFSSQTIHNNPWSLGEEINGKVYNRVMYAESTDVIKRFPGRISRVKTADKTQYFIQWNPFISVELFEEKYHPCSFLEFELDNKNKIIKRMYCLIHGDGTKTDPRDYACIGHKPGIKNGVICSILLAHGVNEILIKGVPYSLNRKIKSLACSFS